MNRSRLRLAAVVALLLVGSVGGKGWSQGIPSRGRAIQFSDPKVEVVTSNLNQTATSRKSTLRSLDDQFKAPFNVLESADTVDGVRMPVPVLRPPALNSKAARQLIENKKEQEQWIFGSPEELEAKRLSAERMFGLTEYDENGLEKSTDKTPFQRFWDRQDREQQGQTNRLGAELTTEKSDQEIKDQARVMFGIPNLSKEATAENRGAPVKSSLSPTYGSSFLPDVSPLRSSSELFSVPNTAFAPEKNEAAVSRMHEFKQLFDIKTPSSAAAGDFLIPRASVFSRPGSVSDYAPPATTWRPPSTAPISSFDSLQGSSVSKPLGGYSASSFAPAPPPVFQPPRATAPPVGFQLPKRSF